MFAQNFRVDHQKTKKHNLEKLSEDRVAAINLCKPTSTASMYLPTTQRPMRPSIYQSIYPPTQIVSHSRNAVLRMSERGATLYEPN